MATTEAAFTPFSVGQIVQFVFGTSLARGQIIEDRGPLGAEGRHIDRLRVDHDPYDPAIFEMPEDELELVPDDDTAASRSISALEVVDYLQRGGLLAILRADASEEQGRRRVWLCRDSVGNLTHTYVADRGVVGGATIPSNALHDDRVRRSQANHVLEFLRSFGISNSQAQAVLKAIGTVA